MSLEQLAVLGIVIFGFMAAVNMFNAIRTYKRTKGIKPIRVRRLVGGRESAKAMAESLVKEVMSQHPKETTEARETGRLSASLEERLDAVRGYYVSRVEPVHKTLFNEVVTALILNKK